MTKDIEIFTFIANEIIGSLEDDKFYKIKSEFILALSGKWCNQTYYKIDEDGPMKSISVSDSKGSYHIHLKLEELRAFMVSQGQPPWTGMTFTLHANGHFETEFSYDPLEDDD